MKKVTKAIIPCGGRGTRFLPITKALAKEMLPVLDTPILAYIVDEFVKSGITDIHIILAPGKESIKQYFTRDKSLEDKLLADNKTELYELICNVTNNAQISFGEQPLPKGSGDAVYRAKAFTGGEPFIMATGDDLMVSKVPVSAQLISAYEKTLSPIIGVLEVLKENAHMYGVVKPSSIDGRFIKCESIIEKPKTNPPSLYAAMGRYLLTNDIFTAIENIKPDANGELQLTEALLLQMKQRDVYAYDFEGKRYDMGDKFGSLQAIVELSLSHPKFGQRFRKYLKDLTAGLE